MKTTALWVGVAAALAGVVASAHLGYGRGYWHPHFVALAGGQSHQQVLARLGPIYRPALQAAARQAGGKYPPDRLRLIGLKQEKVLEVWVRGANGWKRLRSYQLLAASGGPGPKLTQGDNQVPEGIYRLTGFNPNSSYHLSIRVDYPNGDDRAAATAEGRRSLGGDIFIHGKAVSIGCLAIGDQAIEELYLLLGDTGLGNARLILSPSAEPRAPTGAPRWWSRLYERIQAEITAVRGDAGTTGATVGMAAPTRTPGTRKPRADSPGCRSWPSARCGQAHNVRG